MFRSTRSFGLVAVLLVVFGYWTFSNTWNVPIDRVNEQLTPSKTDEPETKTSDPPVTAQPPQWSWTPSRDRDSHSLTESQCHEAFPELYVELDRAAAFWERRLGPGGIKRENIDLGWSYDGGLRAMIYDQQLYVVFSRGLNHFKHWRDRSLATLHQINRALLTSPEPVPNIEFTIKINDKVGLTEKNPNTTFWAFSRNVSDPVLEQIWVIPDFNFWNYNGVAGSFSDYQHKAMELDGPMTEKKPQMVWRGTTHFNPEIREALVQQSKGQKWSDVRNVDENTDNKEEVSHRLSMPDHCKYMFGAHTEGTTWSGRLKYLLSCHNIAVVHRLSWTTHLYHLLNREGPDQNHLAVDPSWVDLPDKIEWLLQNPAEAQRIADNAANLFRDRYITPAAQTCYWRQLFKTWASISFRPEAYEFVDRGNGVTEKKHRGMTYEEYIFWEGNYPPDAH